MMLTSQPVRSSQSHEKPGLHKLVRLSAALACTAALYAGTLSQAHAHEFKLGTLTIDHPWSRATPAGAKVAAGYLVVRNSGAEPDRLISATAEVAETAEIHEMGMKNGIMSMRAIAEGLEVPAGSEMALKPGGYHLMLLGLKRPLHKGEKFAGTLTFEHAGTVSIEYVVEGVGSTNAKSGHNQHAH